MEGEGSTTTRGGLSIRSNFPVILSRSALRDSAEPITASTVLLLNGSSWIGYGNLFIAGLPARVDWSSVLVFRLHFFQKYSYLRHVHSRASGL